MLEYNLRNSVKENEQDEYQLMPTEQVEYSREKIRDIDGQTIYDLKESIRAQGILQPLLVYLNENGKYEVICGNHRLCAAKGLGLPKVPVIVKKKMTPWHSLMLALNENIQRFEMDPVKQGKIFSQILQKGCSLQELAQQVGKTTAYVKGRIDIYTKLNPELQIEIGKRLTLQSAIQLTKLTNNQQKAVFEKVEHNRELEQKKYTMHSFGGYGGYSAPHQSHTCMCSKCGAKHFTGVDVCRYQMTC